MEEFTPQMALSLPWDMPNSSLEEASASLEGGGLPFFGQSCCSLPGFRSGSGSVSLGLFGTQAKWVPSLNEKIEFSSEGFTGAQT